MENTTMPNALRRLLIIFGVLLALSLLASGFSAVYVTLAAPQHSTYVPTTIGFEGQLADAQGEPVADNSYEITFKLYDDDEGGAAVWTETQPAVSVKDGLYSVQLGSVTAFDADDFNGARWLAVKVGSDAEMTPRIQVGAVPFALNAKYAAGLQDNPVADTEPETGNALMWTGTQWAPQGMTFPDLAPVGSNASPNALLQNYRSGATLTWTDASTVTVAPGELMVNGYMRRNTDAVPVTFTEDDPEPPGPISLGLIGSPQANTVYDVYAVASDGQSTFDIRITEEGTNPTDTNYRKIGSFKTVSGASGVEMAEGSAANVIDFPQHVPMARVTSTTSTTLPAGVGVSVVFNTDVFDNDNIHDETVEPTRLVARTPGKYLIFGGGLVRCNYSTGCSGYANVSIDVTNVNGTTRIVKQYHIPGYDDVYSSNNYNWVYFTTNTVYHLDEGDYVELVAAAHTVSYVLASDLFMPPYFGMVWLGP